jgi:hypothetical protein
MKNLFLLASLALVTFTTCKKDEPIPKVACLKLERVSNWRIEKFKNDYSIQFPSDYEGGIYGFEGNIFYKFRTNKEVAFDYSFCGPVSCEDFGIELENPHPATINLIRLNNQVENLNNRLNLCDKGEIVGVYYYSSNSDAFGKIYLKDDDKFKEALSVKYKVEFKDEVEKILKTIKKK